MADKLYPPNIEGTIPAFYGSGGTARLIVPFSMNRTVSKSEVKGMQIKVKSVYGGKYIYTRETNDIVFDPYCQANFTIDKNGLALFNIGQYYKIQIAYIDNDNIVGYFSTVGVVKYTAEPSVSIEGLKVGNINNHQYDYVGIYSNKDDKTEKLYSYCFNLYDNNNKIVLSSGEKIHNVEDDFDLTQQIDKYSIEQDLETNKTYYLEYVTTSLNGLQKSSDKYRIMQKKSINPEIKAELKPILNFENGYAEIKLIGQKNDDGVEYASTGAFKILRASSEDNYQTWNEILKFSLYGQQPSKWSWKDFTVKQGVFYKYALQQYNDQGLTSNRLESDPIFIDYEHAFLYDGEKQLKIKYNPKVSSFKNTLLEAKIDTIGGKHPFIFRNGNVKYKEFSISGLLSCALDDELLFTTEQGNVLYDNTINLTGENIAVEREFKLQVLEWLNNGEPKLFRSPTEGNYLVRLMNVSLTPNDTVGRMLHTFQATAYEIAEYNYNNLNLLGMISTSDPTTEQLRWETIELNKVSKNSNILNYRAVSLRFEGMVPGDKIKIDDGIRHYGLSETGYEVTIGVTGSYIVDLEAGMKINGVYFIGNEANINLHQGTLTYAYYSKVQNRFDTITDIEITDAPLEQYIGEHDIINEIEDVKTEIQNFYWINCSLRAIYPLYEKNGEYYTDPGKTNKMINYDAHAIYKVYFNDDYKWLDGYTKELIEKDAYSSYVNFNDKVMDLSETLVFTIKNPININKFSIGNGIIAEITYQKQIIEYSVEKENSLKNLKTIVDNAYTKLYNSIWASATTNETTINKYREEYKIAYENYIIALEKRLKEKEEAQGDVV